MSKATVLTRPAVNTTVNKIDIQRVRYHYLRNCVTMVWSLWCHQQLLVTTSADRKPSEWDMGMMCKDCCFLKSFMDLLCHVRNKIMYVLSWRTVSALTLVLFWCLFPLLLCNSGNKHQNYTLVSAETVRHSSTYIILYLSHHCVTYVVLRT